MGKKMEKVERGDLVVVFWFDIEDDPTWKPVELVENEKLPLCKSVGWFVNEDEKVVEDEPIAVEKPEKEETAVEKVTVVKS